MQILAAQGGSSAQLANSSHPDPTEAVLALAFPGMYLDLATPGRHLSEAEVRLL